MDKSTTLRKTCSACGQSKPLTSFLQLGGPEGTMYGTVCADCRKAGLDKPQSLDSDDSTTRHSGAAIKSEQRLHTEITKKMEHVEAEEEFKKEQDKKDEQKDKKQQKIKSIATKEKKHREDFLKKSSFIDNKTSADKQKAAETQQKTELRQKKDAATTEEKLKGIDLTGPYIPSQTGGQIKLQGDSFLRLKTWLGTAAGAAINQNLHGGATGKPGKEAAKNNIAGAPDSKENKNTKTPSVAGAPKTPETQNKNVPSAPENKELNKNVKAPVAGENKLFNENKNIPPTQQPVKNPNAPANVKENKNLNAFDPAAYKEMNRRLNTFTTLGNKEKAEPKSPKEDMIEQINKTWRPKS